MIYTQATDTFSSSRYADSAISDVSLGDYFIVVVLVQNNNDKTKLVLQRKRNNPV